MYCQDNVLYEIEKACKKCKYIKSVIDKNIDNKYKGMWANAYDEYIEVVDGDDRFILYKKLDECKIRKTVTSVFMLKSIKLTSLIKK